VIEGLILSPRQLQPAGVHDSMTIGLLFPAANLPPGQNYPQPGGVPRSAVFFVGHNVCITGPAPFFPEFQPPFVFGRSNAFRTPSFNYVLGRFTRP